MSAPPPLPSPTIAYATADPQTAADNSHMQLLSVFHYVWAGLLAVLACIPIIHVVIGVLAVTGNLPQSNAPNPPPPQFNMMFGVMFILMGSIFILAGWTLAVLNFLTGRYLGKRRRRTLTLVVAAINCSFVPIGTVLGVFTLIVLLRPSVTAQYPPA